MLNNRLRLQQFKFLFFLQSLLVLLTITTNKASAAIDIKDTDYPIPSDAYFVSPDGKDTNSGSDPASPWPVAKAIASAPSGATIVFRGGAYRDVNAVSINKRLTLQPYPHEKVWIKGSVVVTGWIADGTIWRKDGWSYSFSPNVSSQYIDPNYPLAGYRDMVFVDGVSLKQVASKDKVVPGTFYVDSVNDQLYIGDNPTGKKVEATALDKAFVIGKTSSSDASGTSIRGLGFSEYADQAVILRASHVTFEDNTFLWNGVEGLTIWGTWGNTTASSTDTVVRGNIFSYNGRRGLGGNRAHRMLLENNTISYNNVEHFSKKWDAAGIKLVQTNELLWRNNIVENNYATGMWIDVSCAKAKIVHNTIRNNESNGIYFEISHNVIIAANLIYKNDIGIQIFNSSSARIYNNTLVDNVTNNLKLSDTTRNNTNADEIADGITWIARNNVVKNNIFSNTTGSSAYHFNAWSCGSDSTKESSALMIPAADYNAYHRTSSRMSYNVFIWSLGTQCPSYSSVAAFNAVTAYEAHALVIDNVANPFFVDQASNDYRLKPDSPAIGSGESLPADIASATGWASGGSVDLGALQSQAVLVSKEKPAYTYARSNNSWFSPMTMLFSIVNKLEKAQV